MADPIFTLGSDLSGAPQSFFGQVVREGCWLVSDQVLARPGAGLHQQLGESDRMISVHCPHKAIGVNGFKFAAVAFAPALEDAFLHWADVVFGGLGNDNVAAVRHFLSPRFDDALRTAQSFQAMANSFLGDAASRTCSARWSNPTTGIFGSFTFPNLPPQLADEPASLWEILEASGASFIPGTRNHMPASVGFSFRVNITRDSPQLRGGVARILKHLDLVGI